MPTSLLYPIGRYCHLEERQQIGQRIWLHMSIPQERICVRMSHEGLHPHHGIAHLDPPGRTYGAGHGDSRRD